MKQFMLRADARLLSDTVSRFLGAPRCDPPPGPTAELTEALRPYLSSSPSWHVYDDGSHYPAPGSSENLLGEAGSHIGGCGFIFAPT